MEHPKFDAVVEVGHETRMGEGRDVEVVVEVTSGGFAALDQDEQVSRLHALAAEAVEAWDWPAPRLDLVKYRENAVFAVTSGDGRRAVLRVHRPRYRSDLDIRCELAWMRHLDGQGIATPQALTTREGKLVVTVSGRGVPEARQCDLMEWAEGSPPGTLEGGVADSDDAVKELYREVGAVAARMHTLVETWARPVPFSRPAWDVATLVGDAPTFGRFEDLDVISAEQMAVLIPARDRVRQRLTDLGPADALIHGDLVPDNILIDGEAMRIIDFDDFGWSWVGFEMATSLFPLQISGGFDAGLEGYLEGYRGVRAFPDRELELLPDMLLARSFSYLGWPVGRPEIASARDLAPMFAFMVTEAAERYLVSR
jgi:Ser/Thr protein kinase RdoA (MazF antagonist)